MLKRAQRLVGAQALETATSPVDDPATTIVAQEAGAVRAALAELTHEQQHVVLLRFVAGFVQIPRCRGLATMVLSLRQR